MRPKARNCLWPWCSRLPSRSACAQRGTVGLIHMSMRLPGKPRIAGKQALLWGGVRVSFESRAGQRRGEPPRRKDGLPPAARAAARGSELPGCTEAFGSAAP